MINVLLMVGEFILRTVSTLGALASLIIVCAIVYNAVAEIKLFAMKNKQKNKKWLKETIVYSLENIFVKLLLISISLVTYKLLNQIAVGNYNLFQGKSLEVSKATALSLLVSAIGTYLTMFIGNLAIRLAKKRVKLYDGIIG